LKEGGRAPDEIRFGPEFNRRRHVLSEREITYFYPNWGCQRSRYWRE